MVKLLCRRDFPDKAALSQLLSDPAPLACDLDECQRALEEAGSAR